MLRQESEGEVTLEETECFGWSNRVCPEPAEGVLPGDTFQEEKVASLSIMLLQDLTFSNIFLTSSIHFHVEISL